MPRKTKHCLTGTQQRLTHEQTNRIRLLVPSKDQTVPHWYPANTDTCLPEQMSSLYQPVRSQSISLVITASTCWICYYSAQPKTRCHPVWRAQPYLGCLETVWTKCMLDDEVIWFESPEVLLGRVSDDNSGIIFLISPWKHILWVLIRSASLRRF